GCSNSPPSRCSQEGSNWMRGLSAMLLRPHVREQQYVTNGRLVGIEHYQPVDADALAGRRWHAVLECRDVVVVEMHGFVIAGLLFGHLGMEAFGLVLGVIQLGKTIGDFTAADEQFETVADF